MDEGLITREFEYFKIPLRPTHLEDEAEPVEDVRLDFRQLP